MTRVDIPIDTTRELFEQHEEAIIRYARLQRLVPWQDIFDFTAHLAVVAEHVIDHRLEDELARLSEPERFAKVMTLSLRYLLGELRTHGGADSERLRRMYEAELARFEHLLLLREFDPRHDEPALVAEQFIPAWFSVAQPTNPIYQEFLRWHQEQIEL